MKEGVKKANSTVKCGQCSHTAKTLGALKYHIMCSHSKTRRQRNEQKRHTRRSVSQITESQKNVLKKTAPKCAIKPKCPYKCTECDYKCFQKRNLDVHLKKKHQKIEESVNSSNGTTKKLVESDMFSIKKLICSGCDQEFNKDYELYVHMEFVHREELVCLFLSSEDEFDKWRTEVEKVIEVRYILIKITAKKQIYKCAAHIKSDSKDTYVQCPSMIIAKVINDGYQIVFHKKHSGHPVIDYTPPEQIKELSIDLNGERESLQFALRKILRDIYRESCALNTEFAKKLIDQATLLKEYATKLTTEIGANDIQERSSNLLSKQKLRLELKQRRRSTGEFIVKEKEDSNGIQHIPKVDIKCKPIENLISKSNEIVPKILNIFTLSDSKDDNSESDVETKPDITPDDSNKDVNNKIGIDPVDVIPEIKKARSKYEELLSNSTFNETYESFVKTNFEKKLPAMTKSSLAPKDPTNFYNARKKSNAKPSSAKKSDEDGEVFPKSDSQSDDMLVVKKRKKKISVKTKLGQFSPKKSPTVDKSPPSLNVSLTTKFQEYELQEREDDCNILILKF